MQTKIKKPTTAGHTKRLVCAGLVSGLHRKALRLQKLRGIASEQILEAELAYEDLTLQCKLAWDEYHNARIQEPANTKVRQEP